MEEGGCGRLKREENVKKERGEDGLEKGRKEKRNK
jgi:hypothetical protein